MAVSVSELKLFKACPRAWFFHYHEGLTAEIAPDALQTGSNYHSKIEGLYKGDGIDTSDYSKESAMAMAYEKYIYPHFQMQAVEKWVTYEYPEDLGLGEFGKLIGRIDGEATDGHIVEHKSTSSEITEEYEFNLQWDEQLMLYMLATGARKIYYTVCRKPTIRLKKGETDEEFFKRMCEWYDEDTESKIRLLEITRTDEEVARFKDDLDYTLRVMRNLILPWDRTERKCWRNALHCSHWGRRCEYSGVCLNYDPAQESYAGLMRIDTKYTKKEE